MILSSYGRDGGADFDSFTGTLAGVTLYHESAGLPWAAHLRAARARNEHHRKSHVDDSRGGRPA